MNPTIIAGLASMMVVVGAAAAARAGEPETQRYALSWSRGAEGRRCIFAQDLARAVEHRLGRSVFAAITNASFVIDGRIESTGEGFAADVVLYGKDGQVLGQRRVTANEPDCHALDRPLALVLALIIDPNATRGTAAEERGRAPEPAPMAPHPPSDEPPATQRPAPPAETATPRLDFEYRPPRVGIDIAAGVALGRFPVAAPGMETAARFALGASFTARFGAAFWMPVRGSLAGRSEGTWLTLIALELQACRSQRLFPALALLACAGAEPGLLTSQGTGLDVEQNNGHGVFDLVAEGRVAVRLGATTWAAIGAKLNVPLARNDFVAVLADQSRAPIFRAPPLGGSASVGLIFDVDP
jgi:hypothetical protein